MTIKGEDKSLITTSKLSANNFRELKRMARKFYFEEWRGHENPAPAFHGEIVRATRRGWDYITGKSTAGDVRRRLA